VKQIVGGTLDSTTSELKTNFVSPHPPAHFAKLYRDNDLTGAHVIMLGPGNAEAAREALAAWPAGLQAGGGITDANAREWIEAGAEKVSVFSPSNCSTSLKPIREVVTVCWGKRLANNAQ
jgi:phosphoribosylformimino-5-aminoimidazole carboxamide ribotide isomerase